MKKLDSEKREKIGFLCDQNLTYNHISKLLDVSHQTVRKYSDHDYNSEDFDLEEIKSITQDKEPNSKSHSKDPDNVIEDYQETTEDSSEDSEDSEDIVYCGACGSEIEGQPSECPSCESELNWKQVINVS